MLTGGKGMEIVLLVTSILLITVVLLQIDKSESAGNILMGGNTELFAQRKERGFELFLSRFTLALGIVFFLLCVIMSLL